MSTQCFVVCIAPFFFEHSVLLIAAWYSFFFEHSVLLIAAWDVDFFMITNVF